MNYLEVLKERTKLLASGGVSSKELSAALARFAQEVRYYPWSSEFGTKYSNPGTAVPSTGQKQRSTRSPIKRTHRRAKIMRRVTH